MEKEIVFIANNNVGTGLSGGDRIFIEFIKNWQNKIKITVLASQEAIVLLNRYKIKKINIIETDKKINISNNLSIIKLIKHIFRRTYIGISTIYKNAKIIKEANYIYSVSDFYPDLIPALIAKTINPKITWIAGYYLFAASPFSINFPYKGKLILKGIFYWLMQIPSYLLCKLKADIVFVTSHPDIKKFNNKKVIVIQGGVDITESDKYLISNNKNKKKYDAVFIGRLHSQKGILELIDVWKIVTNKIPGAKLAVVGNGELEKEVRSKITKLKLKNNIKLFGFLDGSKKHNIFKLSKIVVHPAIYDSGGMAAAEAMAWGLPGVSFDLESLKTYYPQGMIKIPLKNYQLFADNIIKLLNNNKLYKTNSTRALELIRKNWDWSKRSQTIYNQIFL